MNASKYRNIEQSTPKIPPVMVEITIIKGNQSITLSPEDYARLQRRMENAFMNSLIVVEE